MTCPARITVEGKVLRCEVRGHRKPETLGPVHKVRGRLDGRWVVMTWPTLHQ